jgi:hypothetical protein
VLKPATSQVSKLHVLSPQSTIFKAGIACIVLALGFLAVPMLPAQQPKEVPAAPLPSQLFTARTMFISNAGGEADPNDTHRKTGYDVEANRTYNLVYAAMKSWGRYSLVSMPADADLVVEVHFVESMKYLDQFRLTLFDPKTHTLLWTLTRSVEPAFFQHNRDKNFDLAINGLVDELKDLVQPPAAPGGDKK